MFMDYVTTIVTESTLPCTKNHPSWFFLFTASIENYCSHLDTCSGEDIPINQNILEHMAKLEIDPEQTIKVSAGVASNIWNSVFFEAGQKTFMWIMRL